MKTYKTIPAQGKLLLSEPFQRDLYFKRTVVLLVEHNEKGSIGFILNKPIDLKLNDALSDFPDYTGRLHFGGPVNKNQLFYIHTLGDQIEGSLKVGNGLYWGGNFDTVKMLIDLKKINPDQIRFFVGYSGWEPAQLETELQEKAWIISNANANQVMGNDPKHLWGNVLKTMGPDFAIMANFPEDPSLN